MAPWSNREYLVSGIFWINPAESSSLVRLIVPSSKTPGKVLSQAGMFLIPMPTIINPPTGGWFVDTY